MSSLLSIPSTQSLPEVWVTDCWLYFATTLCWSIDHCRNNLESPQHQLHLNLTDKHCRRMGGEKDGNVSWNYFCWRQLELKLRCCEMIVLVESDWEREREAGGGNRCRICDLSPGPSRSSPLSPHRYEQWLQLKWPRSWRTRDSRGR